MGLSLSAVADNQGLELYRVCEQWVAPMSECTLPLSILLHLSSPERVCSGWR